MLSQGYVRNRKRWVAAVSDSNQLSYFTEGYSAVMAQAGGENDKARDAAGVCEGNGNDPVRAAASPCTVPRELRGTGLAQPGVEGSSRG